MYNTVTAACNVRRLAYQVIWKGVEHILTSSYSEIGNYGQKLADGGLLFWTLVNGLHQVKYDMELECSGHKDVWIIIVM